VSSTVNHSRQVHVRSDQSWKTILECAAIEVFEMMAGARLEPLPMSGEDPVGDRTAMVGMAGALCGMITIRCSSAAAAKLASLMLDGTAAESPSTVGDALGELCNMVAGNFKSKISNLADHCMLSVPTVISGGDYYLQATSPTESFQLPLKYEGERVWIALTVHE
jgi:chemotaxis protein CheX